jgi:hypothetical protein
MVVKIVDEQTEEVGKVGQRGKYDKKSKLRFQLGDGC